MDPIWIRIRIHNIASELTWGEVYTVPVHVWLVTKSARYILYTYSIYCITVHILIYWHCNRRPVRHWFHSKYTCEFKGKLLFYSFKWRDPDSYTGWKSKKSKICRNLKKIILQRPTAVYVAWGYGHVGCYSSKFGITHNPFPIYLCWT